MNEVCPVSNIKSFLGHVAQPLAPPKYVEAPLAGAQFVVPLDELSGEAFEKFMEARMESFVRRAEIDRRILAMFGVTTNNPLKVEFGAPLRF